MRPIKEVYPITNTGPWLRGVYMLLFSVIYKIVELGIFFIAAFQYGHNIFIGQPQAKLVSFGKKLSDYNYSIYLFLTFNSETRPYPFNKD